MRPRYKQTEVGAIPEDWAVSPLGRLVTSVEYGSSAKSSSKGSMPVLRMGNLQGGKIDWSDLVYTDDEREIAKYALCSGDVLFNRTNTIDLVGKTSIYRGEQPAIFAGYLIRVKAKSDLLDSRFLNYTLNTELAKKYSLKVLSIAVGQANINGQKLRTYPIPLPPTTVEQSAIATALSDVDALLSSLDALIAKKRDIKQAAMQQLLTGETRLPGFEGKWDVKRLKDIAPLQRGFDLPTSELVQGDYPVVYSNGVLNYHAKYQVEGPGVVTGRSGTIGNVTYVEGRYWPHNTALWVTSFKGNDPRFVFYLYSRIGLDRFATGSGVPTLNRNDVHAFSVEISPTKQEQTAIAEVLSDMDAELAALEARRDKTRLLKQGMMQELLTGKTRLV
ncbi:restriction endonuclease subunit S [Burkholderia gladioli]|uniref:restriction endonuclease subunit S n=1 Tax=Burkholderia gladioli TaxID=28095 RepID=UPI001F1C646A|nr:restriction endonuclease subunit S [Burkholderia gladioli]